MNYSLLEISGIIISIFSIIVTLIIFYSSINKKLKYLINKDTGTISHQQAIDLAELYTYIIQEKILNEATLLLDNKLNLKIKQEDIDYIEYIVNSKTNEIIDDVKQKFSSFILIGGVNYKDYITRALLENNSITRKSKKEILLTFNECVENNINGERLRAKILNIIKEAGNKSLEKFKKDLYKMYIV